MASIQVASGGSAPVVTVEVGGLTRCFYTFFIQLAGSGVWQKVLSSSNEAASTASFTLTPATVGQANWTPGFQCFLGWSGHFEGGGEDADQPYSITLSVTQDDTDLLTPPFNDAGTFKDPVHSFVSSVTLEVI